MIDPDRDPDRTELLEIYKLHAELADRVSQRREGANRLYVSLLTFTAEWKLLAEGRKRKLYWRLTNVETGLPWIFFGLFVVLALYAFTVAYSLPS